MKLIDKIKAWFNPAPAKPAVEPHPFALGFNGLLVYAFTDHNGVDYFQCSELYNDLPIMRFEHCLDANEDLLMRMTKELYDLCIEQCLDYLNKGELVKAGILLTNMKERTTYSVSFAALLKKASCVYITREESPYFWDKEYNEKKIQSWIDSPDHKLLGFFLQQPIKSLLPFLTTANEHSRTYLLQAAKSSLAIFSLASSTIADYGGTKNLALSIQWEEAICKKLRNCSDSELGLSTSSFPNVPNTTNE